MSVLIKYKPNVFKGESFSKEMETDFLIETLKEFRLEYIGDFPDMFKERVCIFINGEEWEVDNWNGCMLEDGDTVEVIPEVHGGKGGWISVIIGAALIATGVGMAAYAGGMLATGAGFVGPTGFVWGAWSTGLVLAGSSLVLSGVASMILAPKPPSIVAQETSSDSPSYSWEGPSLLSLSNLPIPVVYGELAVGGNIISQYISSDGSDSYINMLIALSEGPIEGIMKSDGSGVCTSTDDTPDILINDQPYSVYEESEAAPVWDYRLGANTQSIVEAFRDIHTYYADGRKVTKDGIQYTTNGDSLNSADIHLYCPALYRLEGETLKEHTVPFEVAYSDDGGGTWNTAVKYDTIVDDPSSRAAVGVGWHEVYRSHRFNTGYFGGNHVDVRVKYSTDAAVLGGKIRIYGSSNGSVLKIEGDIGSGNRNYTSSWRTYAYKELVRIEIYVPSHPHMHHINLYNLKINVGAGIMVGSTQSQVEKVVPLRFSSPGEYTIRVRRMTDDSTDIKIADDLYWKATDEVINSQLTYPNTALLYLKVKASEVISGAAPNVVTKIRGKRVRVPLFTSGGANKQYNDLYWDGSAYKVLDGNYSTTDTGTFVKQWTQNPVYCTKDFLTSKRYGLGEYIATTLIDNTYLDAAARNAWTVATTNLTASEHKFHLDVSIDNDMDAPTAMGMLAKTFRGWAIWSEGTLKLLCDKVGTPVQLFTMGNIISDSFSEQFAPHSKVPNVIECQFANRDRKYNVETREVVYEPDWVAGKPKRVHKEDFRGITRESQALREGTFFLNCARMRTKSISFRAGLDSIHAVAGDLVNFQHDVNKWGYGGRIVESVNASTVVVDASFTATTNGVLFCVASDGAVQEYGAGASPADYTFRTTATIFSPRPRVGDVWAYGKRDVDVQTYRILSVSREENDEVGITALEYNASVYDDAHVLVASPRYDKLVTNLASPCPPVANLTLTELTDRPGFVVGFTPRHYTLSASRLNYISNYSHAEVWVEGQFFANDYGYGDTIVAPVVPGGTYEVKVYSVNTMNVRNTASPAIAQVSVINFKPPTPTGLRLDQDGGFSTRWTGKNPKFTWNRVSYLSGAGVGDLGGETGGFGEWAAIDFDDNYRVEVWKNATMYREEVVTDNFYTYTYEFNKSDFGVPASSFDVRVYGWNNRANLKSDNYAELAVSNALPSVIAGLTTNTIEDGVNFSWNKNDEKDFSNYRYRYSVATRAGVYSASSDWSDIETNDISVRLSLAQLKNQGQYNSNIRFDVLSKDLYGDMSGVTTTSASTQNLKPELVVSPSGGEGVFKTIASAVAAIPSGGGSIVLKAGTYNVDASIHFPNENIDMYGVNRDSVIINTATNQKTFVNVATSAHTYHFSNFTMNSRNATLFPAQYLMYFRNTTAVKLQKTKDITLDNLKFNLTSKETKRQNLKNNKGDTAVYTGSNKGRVVIRNCVASGGVGGLWVNNVKDAVIENCQLNNQTNLAMYVQTFATTRSYIVRGNAINDCLKTGMQFTAGGGNARSLVIEGNIFTTSATELNASYFATTPINVSNGKNYTVANNIFDMTSSRMNEQMVCIWLTGCEGGTVSGNSIYIDSSGSLNATLFGIIGNNTTKRVNISANNVEFTNTYNASANLRGVEIQGSLCTISNNVVSCASPWPTVTRGLSFSNISGRNYGRGNVLINCDAQIVDNGSNNDVIATYITKVG